MQAGSASKLVVIGFDSDLANDHFEMFVDFSILSILIFRYCNDFETLASETLHSYIIEFIHRY